MNPQNLVVSVLGNRNSGKTTTWNRLFGRTVRTGRHLRKLWLNDNEFVWVFLVSSSPEEREKSVADIIKPQTPRIVLYSMQYRFDVKKTIDYFANNNFWIYTQWLNPGYNDPNHVPATDTLGIGNYICNKGGYMKQSSGQTDPAERINDLQRVIYDWATDMDLLVKTKS